MEEKQAISIGDFMSLIRGHLEHTGYQILQDNNESTIQFQRDGLFFVAELALDTTCFLRITLPNILVYEESKERDILELTSRLNCKFKGAKAFAVGGPHLWVMIDQFITSLRMLPMLIDRMLEILKQYRSEFGDEYNKLGGSENG